jgi:hypothetical protein
MRIPKQSECVYRGPSSAAIHRSTGIGLADCNCGRAGLVSTGGPCCMAGRVMLCNGNKLQGTDSTCWDSYQDSDQARY